VYTVHQRPNKRNPMFKALLTADAADYIPDFADPQDFTPDQKLSGSQIVDGKVSTADWLKSIGVDDNTIQSAADQQAATEAAQKAFTSLTAPLDADAQRQALAKVDVPEAVKHLVGMLTAYDWAFVEQAKELRGYCIAQLLEESKHPDAKIRLKSIELLGKVTEVALFTERVEVKKVQLSDDELESELRQRMERYYALAKTVEGVEVLDPAPDNAENLLEELDADAQS
jgi:hypothetical protein